MSWKQWITGELVRAAELQSFIQDQVVAVFADAAERDAIITAPVLGQHAWLSDSEQLTVWTGSAWRSARTAPFYGEMSRPASTACPDGTPVQVGFTDTGSQPAGYRTLTGSGGGLTVTVAGVYQCTVRGSWTSATHRVQTQISVNGAGVDPSDLRGLVTGNTNQIVLSVPVPLSAGQQVGMRVTAYGAAGTLTAALLRVVGPL